jgi:type IV pilus assembly protein PilE
MALFKSSSHAVGSGGFTLIELLVVMTLVVILGLIAYPSFQSLVFKARRGDARAALMQIQQHQERWRAQNSRYADLAELGVPAASARGHYQLGVSRPGPTGYELVARAVGSQENDTRCKVLRVIQAGGHIAYASGSDDSSRNPQDTNRQCWPQ